MKNRNLLLKSLLSCLLIGCLFSGVYATTTQNGWNILDQLRDDGRTDDEIRQAMKDLGYNPNEYLGVQTNPKIKVINSNTNNSTTNYSYYNGGTSKEGRDIINKLKKDGRTDEEIKNTMADLGIDYSAYFPSTSNSQYYNNADSSTYISRSCKPYTIQYVDSLSAYTSPDLRKTEYFVNVDYFKRYVDSKNVRNAECSPNNNRINYSYTDNSQSNERVTAPNGKIYFISQQNGSFTSNQLSTAKSFATIDELKNYIKKRNPLTSMGIQNTQNLSIQNQNIQPIVINSVNPATQTHSSADSNEIQTITTETKNQTTGANQIEAEKDSNIVSNLLGELFN